MQRGGSADRSYAFFQVIDKLEREAEDVSAGLLKDLGFNLTDVQEFIRAAIPNEELGLVLSQLSARGLSHYVRVDYNVIRGLAYYTGPVFEAFDRRGEFRAIAGGGRYDNLVKLVSEGKVDVPALGFGMGDVVLIELLKARARLPVFTAGIDVVCLIEDEVRRPQTLHLAQRLRDAGLAVEFSLTPAKPDKQFKRALELKAGGTAQIEDDGSVRFRDLKTREEKRLSVDAFLQSVSIAR